LTSRYKGRGTKKSSRPHEVERKNGTNNKGRGRRKIGPPTHYYTPRPGSLMQYGNYSLLHLLVVVNNAGDEGLITSELLQKLGSKANRISDVIAAAERLKLIERKKEEDGSKHGRFPRIYTTITEHGKDMLLSQFSSLLRQEGKEK
jgi:hypothetical protein